MRDRMDMISGSLGDKIIKFAIPLAATGILQQLFNAADLAVRPDTSVASWALCFVGSLPGVMTILSGMTHENQTLDNINTFASFEPLSGDETVSLIKRREIPKWR